MFSLLCDGQVTSEIIGPFQSLEAAEEWARTHDEGKTLRVIRTITPESADTRYNRLKEVWGY